MITKNGIKIYPGKHKAIEEYPTAKNADEVRRFVAFCNYHIRFFSPFVDLTECLNSLLKKWAVFEWTADCQKSFETLKLKLINHPVLQFPDLTKTWCDV